MNWLDIVLLLVVAGSVAAGLAKGLARVGIGLAAVILGVLVGLWFYGIVGDPFMQYTNSRAVSNLIGFAIIFVALIVLGSVIGSLLAKLFKWVGLSWLDRGLGGLFGLVRGVILAMAILMAVVAFGPDKPSETVARSRTAPYVIGGANVLASLAPHEIRTGFRSGYDKLQQQWADLLKQGSKGLSQKHH